MPVSIDGAVVVNVVVVADRSLQFDDKTRLGTYGMEDSKLGDTSGTYAKQCQSL